MDNKMNRIPLVIGITGHRDISAEVKEKIFDIVCNLLRNMQERYSYTPIHVLSSLAAGADVVCAKAALAAGCELIVPLPMPIEEYRKDFSAEEQKEFDTLLRAAKNVFVVPQYEEVDVESRGFFYRQAGIYVTRHSHILLACWDGLEIRTADGGGTYETVCLMRQRFSYQKDVAFSHSEGIVLSIETPRKNMQAPEQPYRLALTDRKKCRGLYDGELQLKEFDYIDGFNQDREKYGDVIARSGRQSNGAFLDNSVSTDELTMLNMYTAADVLAVHFQKRRLLALRMMAFMGLLFVLFFLFYDELESPMMLFGYGLLIMIALICYFLFTKKRFHDKYILYRVLAEAIRIQFNMEVANVRTFEFYVPWWKTTSGLCFVEDICRIMRKTEWGETRYSDIELLEKCWIDPQINYHAKAVGKKGRRNKQNSKAAQILLWVAVGFFAVVAVIEGIFPWVMSIEIPNFFRLIFPFLHETLTWSALFKIVLGSVSALAAFIANYYGKLALDEQVRGSRRMYYLYTEAKEKLREAISKNNMKDANYVLLWLATAALEENMDWYNYSTENTPEFLIG